MIRCFGCGSDRRALLALGGLLVSAIGSAAAQRQQLPAPEIRNIPYDGRFTFARIKYETAPGGYYYGGLPAWAHGYPAAELNLMKIVNEVSRVRPHLEASNVLALDDPALFKYPVAYMTEAGFWTMTDKEAAGLRAYLLKGGFVIFDDFRGDYGWQAFSDTMRRVLPGEHLQELPLTHPIFHSFFEIGTLEFHQAYDVGKPGFFGMFDRDDPARPLQMVVNFNNDVSEYWEFSDTGFAPIDLSNEAYKLGVNYVVYAMTH